MTSSTWIDSLNQPSICVQAIQNNQKVYANLTNGKTDRIYAIGYTKAIGKLKNYPLTEIKDFYTV